VSAYRTVDANLNRLREALRVIEELFRFYRNDAVLSAKFKTIRHDFSSSQAYIAPFTEKFLSERDSCNDVLKNSSAASEICRSGPADIFIRNCGRACEALRVIEEFAKLFSPELSKLAKKNRYEIYELEKFNYQAFSGS